MDASPKDPRAAGRAVGESSHGSIRTGLSCQGEIASFVATDISTTYGERHEYTIDWEALSQGETGATLQIDSNGDGVFEKIVYADSELTHDEFVLQTAPSPDHPSAPVGGILSAADKLAIVAPYLALLGLVGAVLAVTVVKRKPRN